MASSRGQILKRKYGYLVRIYSGRDPATGQRIYQNQKVMGTKKDADKVMTAMLRKLDMGELLFEPSRMTVKEYLAHWLETAARPKLSKRTFNDYEGVLRRYVYPAFGNRKLTKLTTVEVQSLYGKMLTSDEEEGLSLKPRTVLNTHTVLSSALTQAIKWRMLSQNVAQYVDLPKQQKPEMNAMTEDEANRFLEAAKGDRHYVLFALMLGTGLRPGEALALMWKDFSPTKAMLFVNRALETIGGKHSFKPPKTPKSRRSIKLPDNLVSLLLEHKGALLFGSDLVFPSLENTPLNDRNVVNRHYNPLLRAAGLGEYVQVADEDGEVKERFVSRFRFYDLRHTHATLLLKAGVHPKIVSERLGHSSITLTLDTYSHVLPGMQDDAANKLDAMLFQNKSGDEKLEGLRGLN